MFVDTHVVTATLLIMVKFNIIFSLELQSMWLFLILLENGYKNIKDSAVSDHLLQCNCTIDLNHFDVLATDVSKFNLLVKESLLIKRDNPVLNITAKSFPLELFD